MTDANRSSGADPVARVQALLKDADARADLRSHSFVLESRRLLYVATPKVACTTIKILLLSIAGAGPEAFVASTSAHPSEELLVHDRERFPVPSLADLDAPRLARALTEDGWLRFCVVRNPYARLYSCWEDKVLVGDPALLGRFGAAGAGDVVDDEGRLDVRRSFAAFVVALARDPAGYLSDPHFRPQHQLVRADDLPYDEIVRLEQLAAFLPRLRAHVIAHGGRDPGDSPSHHSGLGIQWRDAYDPPTAATAGALYREDFERWGYEPGAAWSEQPLLLSAVECGLIRRIRDMNARLSALGIAATRGASAERERDVEREHRQTLASRLGSLERRYEELADHHEALANHHEALVHQHEALSRAHGELAQRHAELGARSADVELQLETLRGRWGALEGRRPVQLYRRLQAIGRRVGHRG